MQPELTTQTLDLPLTPLTYARRAEPAELPEFMDQPCSYADLNACLRDLAQVNRFTRGYKPTLAFLDRIAEHHFKTAPSQPDAAVNSNTVSSRSEHSGRHPERSASARSRRTPVFAFGMDHHESPAASSRPLRILDVGSGAGDTLRAIARWAADRNIPVELTGIDLNPNATRAAQEFTASANPSETRNNPVANLGGPRGPRRAPLAGVTWRPLRQRLFFPAPADPAPLAAEITFVTADVFTYTPDPEPDIVLSALFTHHLATPDIVRFLAWMEQHARLGWFINDLHRSQRAAFWFRFLPVIFGWHRFVAYDGPVSLRRAFIPEDWQRLLLRANIRGASIESHPFNRLCVARIHEHV